MNEEQEAINELKAMSREELDNVAYDIKKWVCQCKKCNRGTQLRDYGIGPEYYWPAKKVWINIVDSFFMCGKHYPFINRLKNIYDWDKVKAKLLDWNKDPIIINLNFKPQNKLG